MTWAVARVGDAAVLPLIALLEHVDASAQFNAAHALSTLADESGLAALLVARCPLRGTIDNCDRIACERRHEQMRWKHRLE